MKKSLVTALASMICCVAGGATDFSGPVFLDGNKLHWYCQNAKDFAQGYAAGAFDAASSGQTSVFMIYLAWLGKLQPTQSPDELVKSYDRNLTPLGSYCVPKGVILAQVTDILCQYLAMHPEERQERANVLLARSLDKAWPCATPKPSR